MHLLHKSAKKIDGGRKNNSHTFQEEFKKIKNNNI
jgi:hypothetical protein